VVAASAEAAAAREPGFTGESNSGVVNILSLSSGGEPVFEFPPPRGLFVMASRTALCGGVLARCAMIVLVLDLDTELAPCQGTGSRGEQSGRGPGRAEDGCFVVIVVIATLVAAAVVGTLSCRIHNTGHASGRAQSATGIFVSVDDAALTEARTL
jgi:hypothetical protein